MNWTWFREVSQLTVRRVCLSTNPRIMSKKLPVVWIVSNLEKGRVKGFCCIRWVQWPPSSIKWRLGLTRSLPWVGRPLKLGKCQGGTEIFHARCSEFLCGKREPRGRMIISAAILSGLYDRVGRQKSLRSTRHTATRLGSAKGTWRTLKPWAKILKSLDWMPGIMVEGNTTYHWAITNIIPVAGGTRTICECYEELQPEPN